MQAMFSRLTKALPVSEQLDILMRNIRPEYMRKLALVEIDSIEMLKTYLKRLELIRVRSEMFIEPQTLDFTLTKDVNSFINVSHENLTKQVAEIKTNNTRTYTNNPQNRKCLRSGLNNHITKYYKKSREILCCKCGQKGVKITECSKYKISPKN